MWKIYYIAVCIICTVCGFLFLPLIVVISILLLLFTGIVFFHDLPLSVHVASLRLWIESLYPYAVNNLHNKNNDQIFLLQRRQPHSNGVVNNYISFLPDKRLTNPNLISRNKLSNDQLMMPLHSTPIGFSGEPSDKGRQSFNDSKSHPTPWSGQKSDNTFSPKLSSGRNVQTVAGPLLVSTRFNSGISAELLADVRSDGFSSRIAQKGSLREGVTHQKKYSGIGMFPVVQLTDRSPKHSLSPRNSAAVSKTVRVRIAPPDNSSFGSLEGSVLSGNGDNVSMKSVLQVLKEMSRKRIHSQVDEEEDEKVKRQKKEVYDENTPKTSIDGGLQNKRGRDDSPRSSEEVKRLRRQSNTAGSNEIMSSLSSSVAVKAPHLMKGIKRKAHTVDWSRSTTPVSGGKLLKVNVSPPVITSIHQIAEPLQVEDKLVKLPGDHTKDDIISGKKSDEVAKEKQSTESGSVSKASSVNTPIRVKDCVIIEAGQRCVLARAGGIKEVPVKEIKMYDNEKDSSSYVNESVPSLSVQRIKDPGRRLKDMLAAIDGNDDIDAVVSDMSPSVIAILKTAKSPSRLSKMDSGLNKSEATLVKSPVSILKTPGSHETHKSVTFSDQVNSVTEKNNEEPVTSITPSSQTCLTTATVVSNSINTSISSASETVPFDYGGLSSTLKTSPSMTNISCVTFPALSPSQSVFSKTSVSDKTSTACTSHQTHGSFNSSSVFTSDTKSSANLDLLNNNPVEEKTIQVSGPSNKFELANVTNSLSGSFSFGVKSLETTQTSSFVTPAAGILGLKSGLNTKTEPISTSFNFSPSETSAIPSATSVLTSVTSVPGSFSFSADSKPVNSNLFLVSGNSGNKQPEKTPTQNCETPKFGGFGFGNLQSNPSNNFSSNSSSVKPSTATFGSFETVNTVAPTNITASAPISSFGTPNSMANNSQVTAPSSLILNTTSASNVNTLFSFGSNPTTTNQVIPLFGSVVSQPALQPNFFRSTTNTIPQTTSVNLFAAGSPQPTMFGVNQSNNVTSMAISTTSQTNPTSVFGNAQTTSVASTTSTFGSGNIFGSTKDKPEGFGSVIVFSSSAPTPDMSSAPASTSTPSLFNHFSSVSNQNGPTLGTGTSTIGNSFPSSSIISTSTPVFGQVASTPLFPFGSQTVATQNSVLGSSNCVNTTAPIINGPSTISGFASVGNNTTESDKSKPSPFGGIPFPTPSFNFGSNAPSNNMFSFGTSSNATPTTTASSVFNSPFKAPEQKPFGFSVPQTSIENSTPIFAFGQNNTAQPSGTPSFQFNVPSSSQQPSSTGLFNFGAGTNATNSPFGTGINPPTFSIGTPGGFSIGSGGSSTRSSRIIGGRPRRTK